ncbi:hypothetical protein ACFFUT_12820 [Pseudohalocynthiibacter aestuariivivens]|uniref:NfeD-like C-terminal domain-containing protein n=1 Tax=Pseudohalocynthiibacter aestuariivivens TaxID=1591409 RepID=A0ABV5JGT2_9RHOB|nr:MULTISPECIES: hypothetical protein [Pseudohalocynthiibacter]MBS9718152.1 hypothetical protein [Pseudohalocynthiibacter aestuariivivens]MCK0103802.1 hypothetical protein [Pseudohalocynthiibacter sp. F2068]
MNKDLRQQKPFKRLPYWIRGTIYFWLLLGGGPVVYKTIGVEYFIGVQYLPSPDWVSQARIPAIVSGSISAVLLSWGVAVAFKITDHGTGKLKKFGTMLLVPSIGFMIGSYAVTVGGPMIGAVIAGVEIEAPFTVAKSKRWVDQKCRNPIRFAGLPYMFDEFCGSSEEFGRSLEIGGQVFVIGRGTETGVFVRSIRLID